ncbi:organic solute transporter subunit alpha/Transmembrane protein, partial [Cladochytrium replicatum]
MLSSTFLPRDWLPVATCEEYEKNPVIVPPSEPDPFHTYETYIAGWILSGLFTVFATCSSLYLIYGHLTHYRIPEIQRPINRILLMVPVYAIISFLSYRFISYAVFFNVIRDCYEGFVIWCFFGLLLQYLGPDMNAQRAILASKSRRRLPPPACCFKHDPSWRHFLNLCKLGIMQYVIVRISTTILAVVLEINNAYCPESMSPSFGHFWATILNALSVGLAMFTLFAFYLAVHHDLSSGARRVGSSAHPVAQFLSIKFVVFFGFWQGFIVKLLVAEGILHATEDWTAAEVSTAVQSFFVCFEMAIASGLHLWAFAWRDF